MTEQEAVVKIVIPMECGKEQREWGAMKARSRSPE
jgi:hypothetical protein